MTDWRIYYGDGSTFDSHQGDPQDAPGGDVKRGKRRELARVSREADREQ